MGFEQQFFVWIDPDELETKVGPEAAAQYVSDVGAVLDRIAETRIGVTLLNSLRWHGFQVRIAPRKNLVAADETWGENTDLSYNRTRGTLVGRDSRYKPNKFRPVRSVIRFSPEFCPDGGTCQQDFEAKHQYIPTADSVLFHEMTHSLRNFSKKFNSFLLTGGMKPFRNREEFNAVLLTNIFDSEIGGQLRGAYPDFIKLDPKFAKSLDFYGISGFSFDLISTLCDENRGFTRMIGKVNLPFNPIKEFYSDQNKVKKIATEDGKKRN